MSFFRLKDLIRAVRCSTTAAEERAVIQKESAAIRTSFKEDNSQDARYVNVQKLIYIYLLGYPVRFGQLECLKLAASARFSDKRVGYLGTVVLLDETQEILTLLTNSLQSDLNNPDDHIVGLALCTMSNIASPEVCNDLVDEIDKLLSSSRGYVRKKAVLAALRIIRRVPELQDLFIGRVKSFISDKTHGVQLAGVALASEICLTNPTGLQEITTLIPIIIRQLKALLGGSSSGSTEFEVGGIVDPFLQVAYLRLLRIISQDADSVEQINDVLTLVATQTDGSRNVGTAVLYECAVTILSTPSDASLRSLAINLLGKFLSHRDNNIRYVALSTLSQAVITESPVVQRHRTTVLACLRDPDISIRRRALDLSFALINHQNARNMVKELLAFVPIADTEFLPQLTHKLIVAASLYAPDIKWHVDTLISVAQLAGNHVSLSDLFRMIRLIAADCDQGLQWYAVLRAYHLLTKDIREEKMVLLGVWIIGEFGDFLVGEGLGDGANDAIGALGANGAILSDPDGQTLQPPAPLDVVKLLGRIESAPVATNTIRHFVAVALAKLTSRYATHPTAIREVARLIGGMSDDLDAETQTRAVEFEALMRPALDAVREGVVDRMPAPEYSEEKFDADTLNPAAVRMRDLAMLGTPRNIVDSSVFSREETSRQQQKSKSIVADLLGLMGDEDIGTQRQQQQSDALMGSTSPPGGGGAAAASVGSPSQAGSHRQQPQQEQQRYSVNTLLDLVGSTSISTPANNGGVAKPSTAPRDGFGTDYEVSNSNGVAVTFCPVKDHPESDVVKVDVKLINTTSNATISNLAFHAAVLKTQRLTIRPPSGHEMRPNEQVTQSMEVSNPNRTPVRFLVKLSYDHSELGHQEAMIKFSGFPATVL